jgi:hypothetical protein
MTPESTQSFSIPAFDSFEQEVTCVPGSAIWGFTFFTDAVSPNKNMSFQVRESCTDVPLISEFIRTDSFSLPKNDGQPSGVYGQNLLSKLLVVPSPGLLTVEIANLTSSAQKGQLILWGGEPVPIC